MKKSIDNIIKTLPGYKPERNKWEFPPEKIIETKKTYKRYMLKLKNH